MQSIVACLVAVVNYNLYAINTLVEAYKFKNIFNIIKHRKNTLVVNLYIKKF